MPVSSTHCEAKKHCDHCGGVFEKRPRNSRAEWQSRKYCSQLCSVRGTADSRSTPFGERFWAKVRKPTGKDKCWEWIGAKHKGYGRILGPNRRDVMNAQRASWMLHFARGVPHGMQVCHKCDNPECTNPDHLFLGTLRDNMRDKMIKGRSGAPHGIQNPNTKLNEVIACNIYARIFQGERMSDLAKEFGVSPPTIRNIKRGVTWSYVTGAANVGR